MASEAASIIAGTTWMYVFIVTPMLAHAARVGRRSHRNAEDECGHCGQPDQAKRFSYESATVAEARKSDRSSR
jgi:ribosomal protein L37E